MIYTLSAKDNMALLALLDLIFPIIGLVACWKFKKDSDPCIPSKILFLIVRFHLESLCLEKKIFFFNLFFFFKKKKKSTQFGVSSGFLLEFSLFWSELIQLLFLIMIHQELSLEQFLIRSTGQLLVLI